MKETNCLNCGIKTTNPKFCSKTCSTSFNNKTSPKKKLEGICNVCGIPIHKRNKYCKSCRTQLLNEDKTLSEIIYIKHHKSSAFALVRSRARAIVKKLSITECQICQYNKHIEVAHKRKISSFPLNTLVSVVNHPSNLYALCPNCHWEFDHNLLSKDTLDKLAPLGIEPRTKI